MSGHTAIAVDRGGDASIGQSSYEALARFRLQVRRFFAVSQSILDAGGLPPAQYQAMLAIKAWSGRGPFTVSLLARELFVKLNTAVELVDRMQTNGLVSRMRDTRDRRRTALILTAAGAATLAKFAALHLDEHRRQLSDLWMTVRELETALAVAM